MNAVSLTKLGRMVVLAALFAGGTAAVGVGDVAAQGSNKPKIALYISNGQSTTTRLDVATIRVLTKKFLDPFTASGMYNSIERSETFTEEVGQEKKKQTSGDVRESDILKFGRGRGAAYICIVELDYAFGTWNIGARLVNAETDEIYLAQGQTDLEETDLDSREALKELDKAAKTIFNQIHGRGNMR